MRLLAMLGEDTGGVPQEYRPPEDAGSLTPSGFTREPSLRLSAPSRGGRFLDNFAASIAEVPPPQLRRGAGAGEQFLAGLVSGTTQGFSRGRLTDMAERQLFDRSQAEQTRARVAERDASFKTARTKAEAVKKDRIAQMRRAIERWQRVADQATDAPRRDSAIAEITRIEKDLARLERREPQAVVAPPLKVVAAPKPKPAPKPKEVSPAEQRRTRVAGVVSDLTARGMGDPAGIRAYYNQKGVAAALAKHGITLADLLKAVPE